VAHLVAVASHLHRQFGLEAEELAAAGLPVDVLTGFPGWRNGSRAGFGPRRSSFSLTAPQAALPIGCLRIQLSPAPLTTPYALALLRDLLRRMDRGVEFMVVVEPGANLAELGKLVGAFAPSAGRRVRFAEMSCLSVFAQDNALAASAVEGKPVLVIPREFRQTDARAADELSVETAERAFQLPVIRSRLFWEGGNVLAGTDSVFVGVDTITENVSRLGLTAEEVRILFSAEFGRDAIVLGDQASAKYDPATGAMTRSGQASFHLDLDVALLGSTGARRKPVALVADPARGLDRLARVLRQRHLFRKHFLPERQAKEAIRAGYRAYAVERHPQLLAYAAILEKAGYRVVGMPDLRQDPRHDVFRTVNLDFSYCNVVAGLNRGRPSAHYLPWGIPELDAEAEGRMSWAGVHPVRASSARVANTLMSLSGGLHCFCGSLVSGAPKSAFEEERKEKRA
jgi:hypothetical protein